MRPPNGKEDIMMYNTLSFRIKDSEGLFTEDKTSRAHEWLEKHESNIDWKCNKFSSLESAMTHARKAALYIAQRFNADSVRYSIAGYESDAPSLEIKKADFFKDYEISITEVEI